ncbi:hypothetical protein RN001_013477 [Aquatica leii]|uniref:HEAT repeat-containing protein 6 n=1 Tax=Aquatica leii TaxID=1421715 RepID=A0AAN7PRT6_9COLE|nr:hypothetical protein RN001_013477 [Aquatica leii]
MNRKKDESMMFDNLSAKFSQLLYGHSKGESSHISRILEDFNKLDYHYPIVTNPTKAVLIIHQCCTIIPPDDFHLVHKACQLIISLLTHQHIEIEGQTLSLLTQWCLQALKQADVTTFIKILCVLKALVTTKFLLSTVVSIMGAMVTAANSNESEIALLATQCLETCTVLPGDSTISERELSLLEIAATAFLKHLLTFNLKIDCIQQNKILISSLRGLQNVITHHDEFLKREFNLLLGVVKSYMVYNIKGVNFQAPQKVMPSVLNIPGGLVSKSKEKRGGKIAKQRKPRTSSKKDGKVSDDDDNVESSGHNSVPRTSDSDFSDTEQGRIAKLGLSQDRVRQAALNLLLQIFKLTDKATIFCHWSNFISDGYSANNLNVCILKDPSPKGRMAALQVLLALLTCNKLYLAQAESSKKHTAFTPFSVILGAMVTELHKCLSLALNENSVTVLHQVLKCLAALVQASPYHKLAPGISKKIIRNVKIYVAHRDFTIQIAALIVFECLLGSEPIVPETRTSLLRQTNKVSENVDEPINKTIDDDIEFVDFSSDDEDETCLTVQEVPWLLERCLANLGVLFSREICYVVSPPVKVQSLQVISAMTRNYFDCLILPYLSHIAKALEVCLMDSYADLRLHAGRTIDFIGQAMNKHLENAKTVTPELCLAFWQLLINNSLTALLQSEQHSVLRAVGCDCFASIGPIIFEQLARDKQILIITLLFPCSRDEDHNVRAAAVRALAISVDYPSLRDDPGFIVDVAETIHRTLQDSSVIVRIKASWSLGNLTDALVLNLGDLTKEELPASLLLRLLKIANKISNDNDKIKVNAARALGNLLQMLSQENLQQDIFKDTVYESLESLVKNCTTGTNMKVRWNSCYAIGNVLKKSNFSINNYKGKEVLFQSLINLVLDFPNFKVRLNAALALSCVNDKETYGSYFLIIWESLVDALENTQNIEDFSEYNHQDHLVDQICLTLGHLTTLLSKADLSSINSSVQLHYELLVSQMHKVIERLLPEKSTVLLQAAAHLKTIASEDLTKEQQSVLNCLFKIFVNEYLLSLKPLSI